MNPLARRDITLPGGEEGFRLEIYESLPSTSDLCLTRARAGEKEGLAVLAYRQTAGRGRERRIWQSGAGNLALSVLLRPQFADAATLGRWSLLAGVALHQTLSSYLAPDHFTEGRRLSLKWPNDVLFEGAKLAGILAESETDAHGKPRFVVFGFGVNLLEAPRLADRPTTSLRTASGFAPPPEEVAGQLLLALALWRRRLEREGFAPLREAWLAAGPPRDAPVEVKVGGMVRQGRFAGLDESGALLLAEPSGISVITAGEVFEGARAAGERQAQQGQAHGEG